MRALVIAHRDLPSLKARPGSSDGAIESVAPGSTKNNDSNDLLESVRLVSLVVTLVNPIVPRDYYYDQVAATAATGLPLLRIRHCCTVTARTGIFERKRLMKKPTSFLEYEAL